MTDFKYADFATWWDQQTDIDDDSEAFARRIFKAARATEQAARTAPAARNAGPTVQVDRGALQAVVNMLRRDAEEGRTVRGEMADALLVAPEALPEAAPVAIYQIQAFKGSWDDCDKSVYDRQPVTLRRIVYKAAPASEPIARDVLTKVGPGTPSARLDYLLSELDKRFPSAVCKFSSAGPEPKYLAAIDTIIEAAREGKS